MPSKYKIIMEMASQTARDVTSNVERYTDFLVTAANNYKYSFKEQLLIHAQKPEATACAEIETWNRLGRWVNKGTKGIALLVDRDIPYKLRHVFDISDTNSRAGMIIFYDWDSPNGSSGPQDGLSDHTGIVEKVENGIIYTVEGNSGDSCRENHYPVGYYEILGYGILNP